MDIPEEILEKLPERERFILEKRYVVPAEERMTLKEIGQKLDLTRERVRQLESQALARYHGLRGR